MQKSSTFCLRKIINHSRDRNAHVFKINILFSLSRNTVRTNKKQKKKNRTTWVLIKTSFPIDSTRRTHTFLRKDKKFIFFFYQEVKYLIFPYEIGRETRVRKSFVKKKKNTRKLPSKTHRPKTFLLKYPKDL